MQKKAAMKTTVDGRSVGEIVMSPLRQLAVEEEIPAVRAGVPRQGGRRHLHRLPRCRGRSRVLVSAGDRLIHHRLDGHADHVGRLRIGKAMPRPRPRRARLHRGLGVAESCGVPARARGDSRLLVTKWQRELDYRLKKELWTFDTHRIAVRFEYPVGTTPPGSGTARTATRCREFDARVPVSDRATCEVLHNLRFVRVV